MLYQGGAASGIKSAGAITDASNYTNLAINTLFEVTQAMADAATNYFELYLDPTDSNGNDVIVEDAQFYAKKFS